MRWSGTKGTFPAVKRKFGENCVSRSVKGLEAEGAMKHIRDTMINGIKISKFYGDGAFDTNDLFTLVHAIGASPIIKIRKNASTDHHRGSKYRRKAVREYQNKGYRQWAWFLIC